MKIMKNKILLVVCVLLLSAALPVYADLKPNVVVSGFGAEEGSAEVGKEFTLFVNLINIEPSACAKAATVSLESGFPFIMEGVSTVYAGDLCLGNKTAYFPLKVDSTASGGFYQIKINNNYQSATFTQYSSSYTINVYVNGTPDIKAYITNSEPLDIYPGDTAKLEVTVENNGGFRAESLNAVMKAGKPLEAKWSKSLNSIGVLEPKQSRVMEFAVEVPKDAEAKAYPLIIYLSYDDENKARQSKELNLTLNVKKKAKFETSDSGSSSLYQNQNSRRARILLKNTGTDAARKIRAKIIPQFPFSTDGSMRYIELLETGKSEPVEFSVDIDKDATPGKYVLDMLLDFEDAQGKKFQDTAEVVLAVKPKGFFRMVFIDYWFLWLVAAVVAFIAGRKRMGKKK